MKQWYRKRQSQWEPQGPLGCDIGKKERWCTRTRPREDKERLKSQERTLSIMLVYTCDCSGKDYGYSVKRG